MGNYQDSSLWQVAKALVFETYAKTANWPEGDAKRLADEIRINSRMIARAVPGALKKNHGPGGNVHLSVSMGHFVDLDVLCELAVALGYAEAKDFAESRRLATDLEREYKALGKEAQKRAMERMSSRSMFGMDEFDDDND